MRSNIRKDDIHDTSPSGMHCYCWWKKHHAAETTNQNWLAGYQIFHQYIVYESSNVSEVTGGPKPKQWLLYNFYRSVISIIYCPPQTKTKQVISKIPPVCTPVPVTHVNLPPRFPGVLHHLVRRHGEVATANYFHGALPIGAVSPEPKTSEKSGAQTTPFIAVITPHTSTYPLIFGHS